MADTLQNITLPAGEWVNVYAASGITLGDQIIVQNLSAHEIKLSVKGSEPLDSDGFKILARGQEAINDFGDSGAWPFSSIHTGSINVRRAS